MLDIVDIIFAPVVDQSLVAYLWSKNQEHYMEFYPDASAIPKMYFMVHYPVLMLRYCSWKRNLCIK